MAMSDKRKEALDQRINQIAAVLLPLLEISGTGYATYVVVYLLCVRYLINPAQDIQSAGIEPRQGTGIALLIVYFLLLLPVGLTFMRLLQVVWTNPGVVPLGDPLSEKKTAPTKHFDRLDAYICDYEGLPQWCDACHSWKPDRAHHSSQLGRCIRRMDHFCPYAGGIISETSHKFFVQFLFYATAYTGYVLVLMAIFLAERIDKLDSKPATWIVALALAALFFLFTFGMFATTFYHLSQNYTTIEVLQRGGIHNIALLSSNQTPHPATGLDIIARIQRSPSRSYIVVQTKPFENPWDMGVIANIKSIMGNSALEWFMPLRMSPCTYHRRVVGEYEWGRVVNRMMDEYAAGSFHDGSRRRRRRRRSSRASTSDPLHSSESTPSRLK
ncbi:zf-DHHC-domain-containing protein [Lojkania enalia]|uniref:Palmitoyltransferase n=1 Tax=Lojkania enalia TaxID=147567 RepID=A0A9P4KFC8_9PLEO|nr:zf-DHHC-domain-containing protein [Didymosphaeria enalia]